MCCSLSNTGSTVSIFASFIVDLGGFQMTVVGPPLLSVGGGAAEAAVRELSLPLPRIPSAGVLNHGLLAIARSLLSQRIRGL